MTSVCPRVRVGITITERDRRLAARQPALMTFVDGETNRRSVEMLRFIVSRSLGAVKNYSEYVTYVNNTVIADECINNFRLDLVSNVQNCH